MATFEKRVQVLFDPERHKQLEAAAAEAGVSVGAFIREAVDARLDSESNERLAALQELFARVDAYPDQYPACDLEELTAAYELEMDPMYRLERNKLEAEERERAEKAAAAARSAA